MSTTYWKITTYNFCKYLGEIVPLLIKSIKMLITNKSLRRCVTCRKVIGTSFKASDPAPLIVIRVKETKQFAVTGVDFAGPLFTRTHSGEEKTYICLFTCAVTRAINLKIVSNLVFRRFSS